MLWVFYFSSLFIQILWCKWHFLRYINYRRYYASWSYCYEGTDISVKYFIIHPSSSSSFSVLHLMTCYALAANPSVIHLVIKTVPKWECNYNFVPGDKQKELLFILWTLASSEWPSLPETVLCTGKNGREVCVVCMVHVKARKTDNVVECLALSVSKVLSTLAKNKEWAPNIPRIL